MLQFFLLILMMPVQIIRYKARKLLNRYIRTDFRRSISTLEPEKPPFLMIASIGNPEPQYQGTRHNVGHWALDELITNHWTSFNQFQSHKNIPDGVYSTSSVEDLSDVFLFKSIYSFMNLQGAPVSKTWQKISNYQKTARSPALVVLHDELQVPFGKFQIRKQLSSARGHNGLRSIDSLMGGGYTKISIGIGKPTAKDLSNYVLSPFTPLEQEVLTYDVMPQIVNVLQEMKDGKYIYDKQESDPNQPKKKRQK